MADDLTLKEERRTIYTTSDGIEHSSLLMAQHWIALKRVEAILSDGLYVSEQVTVSDIIDGICQRGTTRDAIRKLLNICDELERHMNHV